MQFNISSTQAETYTLPASFTGFTSIDISVSLLDLVRSLEEGFNFMLIFTHLMDVAHHFYSRILLIECFLRGRCDHSTGCFRAQKRAVRAAA